MTDSNKIKISILKAKQDELMEMYKFIESNLGEEYQGDLDDLDWKCELLRREIYRLEGNSGKCKKLRYT